MTVVTSYRQIPALLLEFVPEAAETIEEETGMPVHKAVRDEDVALDYFNLLGNAFSYPILLPQLRAGDPDRDLVARCFAFVEKLMESPEGGIRSAAYFQCLEPLLNAHGLIETALPFMGERTRREAAKMVQFYAVEVDDGTRRKLGL
ncbi:hypothetical protein [Streptomyces sp. NPDC002537]